jgi:hypothetical protein
MSAAEGGAVRSADVSPDPARSAGVSPASFSSHGGRSRRGPFR